MNTNNKLTIITNDNNWMEGNAINQAYEVCKLDGVTAALIDRKSAFDKTFYKAIK